MVGNPPASARDVGLIPGSRFPWQGKWQPTPGFLPEKSHLRWSPVGRVHGGGKRVGQNLAVEKEQCLFTLSTTIPVSFREE